MKPTTTTILYRPPGEDLTMSLSPPEEFALGTLAAILALALFAAILHHRRERRWTQARQPDSAYKAPSAPVYQSPIPPKPAFKIEERTFDWRSREAEKHGYPADALAGLRASILQAEQDALKASKPVKGYCLEAGDDKGYRWLWHDTFSTSRRGPWDEFLGKVGDKEIRALKTRKAKMAACKRLWHLRLVPVTLQRQASVVVTTTIDPRSPDEAAAAIKADLAKRGVRR